MQDLGFGLRVQGDRKELKVQDSSLGCNQGLDSRVMWVISSLGLCGL